MSDSFLLNWTQLNAVLNTSLNSEIYTVFAALIKLASINPPSNDKLCSELALRNREYSVITQIGNTISELRPNNSHSNAKIEDANVPHSLFALNRSTDRLDND